MTAVHIFGLQETGDAKEKTLWYKTRRVTDKFWLVCLLTHFIIWINLLGNAIYVTDNSVFPCRHATDTSWENSAQIVSSDALDSLTVLIDSTIHFLNTYEGLGNLNTWHAMAFRLLLIFYFITECYFLARRIGPRCDNIGSIIHLSAHFITVNTGWVMTTLIFAIGFFSKYDYLYDKAYGGTFIWFIPTLGTCSMILPLIMLATCLLPKGKEKFKKVLRYYMTCRFLILFRLLNAMMVLLIIALNIALLKNLDTKNMTSLLFVNIGSICTILFLNNYNKIVTMAVISYRDWNKEQKAISAKELAFAMFIIGKYHLGTVFLNTLILVRHIMLAIQGIRKLAKSDVIEEHYGKKMDVLSHVIKRSPILTATHGQDFEEANTNMIWYEIEEKVIFDYKSMSSIVWKEISHIYFVSYILVVLARPIEDAEDLYSRMTLVGIFLVIQRTYNYIVSIMDTVDFANKFYKVENKRNNQASDQKKPEAIKIEKTSGISEN